MSGRLDGTPPALPRGLRAALDEPGVACPGPPRQPARASRASPQAPRRRAPPHAPRRLPCKTGLALRIPAPPLPNAALGRGGTGLAVSPLPKPARLASQSAHAPRRLAPLAGPLCPPLPRARARPTRHATAGFHVLLPLDSAATSLGPLLLLMYSQFRHPPPSTSHTRLSALCCSRRPPACRIPSGRRRWPTSPLSTVGSTPRPSTTPPPPSRPRTRPGPARRRTRRRRRRPAKPRLRQRQRQRPAGGRGRRRTRPRAKKMTRSQRPRPRQRGLEETEEPRPPRG